MREVIQPEITNGFWEEKRQRACPLCGGVGFRMVSRHGQIRAQKCRCISRERISGLQKHSGIPALYWIQTLEELSPRTLEEISLLDSLRDIINDHGPEGLYQWIVPAASVDTERFLSVFANDLIRLQGYSCFWLDCQQPKGGAKREGARQAASWREAASKADFLFVQNFSAVLPKNRQRKMLEEVLRERIRYERSVFIVGAAPSSLTEACLLFEDRSLAASILKEFTVIDPARNEGTSRSARWLF